MLFVFDMKTFSSLGRLISIDSNESESESDETSESAYFKGESLNCGGLKRFGELGEDRRVDAVFLVDAELNELYPILGTKLKAAVWVWPILRMILH